MPKQAAGIAPLASCLLVLFALLLRSATDAQDTVLRTQQNRRQQTIHIHQPAQIPGPDGVVPVYPAIAPQYAPEWGLKASTIMMPCNTSGWLDNTNNRTSNFGTVDVDWSNAKKDWEAARPMDCQERLVEQVRCWCCTCRECRGCWRLWRPCSPCMHPCVCYELTTNPGRTSQG